MATQSQDKNWRKAQKARLEEYHRQRKAGAFDKDKTEEQRKATMKTVKSKGSKFLTGDYTKGKTQVGREDPTSQWSEPTSPTETPQVQTDWKNKAEAQETQMTSPSEVTEQQGVQDMSADIEGIEVGSVQRDFEREQEVITKMGLDPLSVQNLSPKRLMERTYTPEELAGMADYQKLIDYENAKQTMEETPQPNNTMMAALEEALRMKSDPAKQPLGVSQLYEKAGIATEGVSGYATLMQSLNNQSKVMDDNYNNFTSKLSETGGTMADAYSAVKEKYELHKDEINRINKQYEMVLGNVMETEQAMKLLEKEYELEQDAAEWERSVKERENVGSGITGLSPEQNNQLDNVFQLPGESEYREIGWECAEGSNKITDGSHLGTNYYSGKMPYVTKQNNPQVGNQLVIPWGHKDYGGTKPYGHAGTVIGVNGDEIYTVEWNKGGNGQKSFETYNIQDLQKKYGKDWGFTDSTLKPDYEADLGNMLGSPAERIAEGSFETAPDWLKDLMGEYVEGNYKESEIRAKIGRQSGLSDEEAEGYKSLFDRMVDEPMPEGLRSQSVYTKFWDVTGKVFGAEREPSDLTLKEVRERKMEQKDYEKDKRQAEREKEDKYLKTKKALMKLSPNEIKTQLKKRFDEESDEEIEKKYKALVKKYNL